MRLLNELELARVAVLDTMLDSSEPGVQLLDGGPRSCPVRHDHDSSIGKSRS